ncbi:AAA family ATPase [Vibrio breoganii]
MENGIQVQSRNDLSPQISAPKVPRSLEELGIPEAVIENLIIKFLAAYPKSDLVFLSKSLGVITQIVSDILESLRKKSFVEVFEPSKKNTPTITISSSHIRYALSKLGADQADAAFIKDPYLGPVPVSLDYYIQIVESQDLRKNVIKRKDVEFALSDVRGADKLVNVLGPAINSGRALLLYGHAGTGKSFVAARILNSLNSSVYIPFSVYAAGNTIKLYSELHHRRVDTQHGEEHISLSAHYDKRWVLCERPNIQVGGELTMEMLEVNHTEHNRVWNAPLQMMANNGILVIDDLGRQPMPVATLLNRWIVPMEYFIDHLALPNGQQVTIPFVLTMAFSTNLDPKKISDPAFLRRLGYKIMFTALEKFEYSALLDEVANKNNLLIQPKAYEDLFNLHELYNTGYFPCIPKDLLGICKDIIAFEDCSKEVSGEMIQRAWHLYFTND